MPGLEPSNPQTLYAGTLSGVWKSTNGGAGWAASSTGLTNNFVQCPAIDPSGTLYTGTASGVFRMIPKQ
jgi:ligand-binding sensor domain-containing protein